MRRINYVLLLIVLVGFLLRFIQIEQNPPAIHADEADTGYTALSLVKTGHDPYGNWWPLQFQGQAVNFRSPLYTYTTIPFVYFLGLNEFSTRLPSVLFGTLLILCVYVLLKQYIKDSFVPLVGALVAAINPWSIHLSRTGLEVHLSVLLTTLGILFFELGKRNKNYLLFSSIFFTLSLYSYHPAKIFTPLIILILILFNLKFLLKNKVISALSLAILLIGISILGYLAYFKSGASHFGEVSIFDATRATTIVDQQRSQTLAPLNLASVFSSKPVYYLREFVNSFTGPLSVNYLFVNGESNLDKGIGNYGQYHFFELLPFLIGIYFLWRKNKKLALFLAVWFVVGLIPAGVTKNGNYAYRAVNSLVPILLVTSIGFVEGFRYLIKKKLNKVIFMYGILSLILFAFFIYNYFFAYPVFSRDWWAFNQKQAILYAYDNKTKYNAVYINGGQDWDVLYAFYNKVDPTEYQKAFANKITFGDKQIRKLDGIYFGDLTRKDSSEVELNLMEKNSLLIVPGHFMQKINAEKIFYGADGIDISLKAIIVK